MFIFLNSTHLYVRFVSNRTESSVQDLLDVRSAFLHGHPLEGWYQADSVFTYNIDCLYSVPKSDGLCHMIMCN
jgi:hypothetical protein